MVKKVSQGMFRVRFKNFTEREDELVSRQHIRCRSRKISSRGCKHADKFFPGHDCLVFVAHPALQHLRQKEEAWYDARLVRVKDPRKGERTAGGKCHCRFEVRLYKMDVVYQQSGNKKTCTFRPSVEHELEDRIIEVSVDEVCLVSQERMDPEELEREYSPSSASD